MNLADTIDLKWLAGFFDGEGCVTITRRGGVPNALRVTIHGYFPEVLRKIQEKFGGHLKRESEKTAHLYLASNKALKSIEAIAKYEMLPRFVRALLSGTHS